MYSTLSPGGKLLVANFSEKTTDAGYMEAATEWFLNYRTANDIATLITDEIQILARDICIFEGGGCLVLLEITR